MWVPLPTALIPVRLGPTAKRRLAHVLGPRQRAELVERLLARVVEVVTESGLHAVVLSSEPAEVAGAEVWTDQAPGLNPAIDAALAQLPLPVIVIHADLPLLSAADIDAVIAVEADIVIARSYDGGTNGLLMHAPVRPAFGASSAYLHAQHARGAGLTASVLDLPGFAMDVDDEVGLSVCASAGVSPRTRP
jgi:2-phospho-L-lactate guanylyltransferase